MKDIFDINSVMAGIVTFEPEIERLRQNIEELSKQVNFLLIVDNGSTNKRDIKELCKKIEGIHIDIFYYEYNMGIAKALKHIMDSAKENGFKWVLTLDQDSVIENGLIEQYLKAANEEKNQDVGMITCLIKDRNFEDKKYEFQKEWEKEIPYCITSAAFTNVSRYDKTSGYDEKFFIDCVDFDICFLLREAGYRIIRINYLGLIHEVGHGENKRFLWKKIVVYHQKPLRIYYLSRNTVWMWKKHKEHYNFIVMLKKQMALVVRIILYEDDKKGKLKKFLEGIKDSAKYE